MNRIK